MEKSWPAPQGHPTFKASNPPPRVTCKRFAIVYKEMYEKFSRPGLLGMEGDPTTRENFSPYKQALIEDKYNKKLELTKYTLSKNNLAIIN